MFLYKWIIVYILYSYQSNEYLTQWSRFTFFFFREKEKPYSFKKCVLLLHVKSEENSVFLKSNEASNILDIKKN